MTALRLTCGKCQATFKIKAPSTAPAKDKRIKFKCNKCGHHFELVGTGTEWHAEGGHLAGLGAQAAAPAAPAGGPPKEGLPLPPPPAPAAAPPAPAAAPTAARPPAPPPSAPPAAAAPGPDPAQPLDENSFRESTPVKDVREALSPSGLAKLDGEDDGVPGGRGSRALVLGGLGLAGVLVIGLGIWALWPSGDEPDGQDGSSHSGDIASVGPAVDTPPDHEPDAGPAGADQAAEEAADAGSPEPDAGVQAADTAQPQDPGPADEPKPKPKKKKRRKRQVASLQPDPDRKPPGDLPPPIKLTRVEIFKVLRKHGKAFQDCALPYLAKQGPGSKVDIVLKLTIASSGQIQIVKVDPPAIEATSLGRCLLKYTQKLRFPRHKDKSVSIAFPLEFQAVTQ